MFLFGHVNINVQPCKKKIRYCLIGVFDSYWCLRFILMCSILVLAGSKRSSESPGNCGKDLGICLSVSSASATPASSPSQGGSGSGSGGVGGSGSGGAGLEGAGGSGAAVASDIRAAGASDIGAAVASDIGATGVSDRDLVAAGTSTASAIIVEGDEHV